MENSTIMLIRLLDQLNVASVGIAGMDGYSTSNSSQDNYAMISWNCLMLKKTLSN